MNRVLKKIKNISLLFFFFMLIMQVRPAYSIPSSLEEFQQMFGNLCYEYGLDFCASPPKSEEEGNKRKEFTETEKQILTRQEDVQRQISQLEKLQQEIERDIESKKTQDDALLDKAVSFYAKMDAATAAQSINQLETKVAVSILMRMKEKQAADVLSNIPPDQSAKLIAEIAKKK